MKGYLAVALVFLIGVINCNVIKDPINKDPCEGLFDGFHETKDVFQYMVCTNRKVTKYVSCGSNVYDPCTKTCISPKKISLESMCECRANGNVMDPWNCHKYVTCSNGYHYLFNCSRSALVYDPSVDRCVQPGKRQCKEVHTPDECEKKADGRYGTRDAFQYQVCKGKHAKIVSCGDNVYDACSKACVSPKKLSVDTMCKCRGNGNVMHPWNCHKYLTCSNGYHYVFNCSRSGTKSGLVYDPTLDRCLDPGMHACKEANRALLDEPKAEPVSGLMEILESIFPWHNKKD